MVIDATHDVDNTDIGQAFGSYTSSLQIINGPLTPDTIVAAQALAASHTTAGELHASVHISTGASLIYDINTGSVTLDGTMATGGTITNFVLEDSEGGLLNTGSLVDPFGGIFLDASACIVASSDGSGIGLTMIGLGLLLPSGLTLTQLQNYFNVATYVGTFDSGMQQFNFEVVPEPGSLLLLLATGLLAGRNQRRQRAKQPQTTA